MGSSKEYSEWFSKFIVITFFLLICQGMPMEGTIPQPNPPTAPVTAANPPATIKVTTNQPTAPPTTTTTTTTTTTLAPPPPPPPPVCDCNRIASSTYPVTVQPCGACCNACAQTHGSSQFQCTGDKTMMVLVFNGFSDYCRFNTGTSVL